MLIKNISGMTQVFATASSKIEVKNNEVITASACPKGFVVVTEKQLADELKAKNVVTEEVKYGAPVTESKGLMKSSGMFDSSDSSTVVGQPSKGVKAPKGKGK